ncbi:hypothetical protein LXA43DRAFT_747332 [Ganoderma leucocontextum]|nr:hypothetical protein LXA43DRAFT_747332 [Ganoderma leucocontextum]
MTGEDDNCNFSATTTSRGSGYQMAKDNPTSYRTLLINNLPVEILASIFLHVQRMDFVARRSLMQLDFLCQLRSLFTPLALARSTTHWPPFWTVLMLVCRHWRELALATRELWRTVSPTSRSKAEWIDLCLARSAPATLDVDHLVVGADGPLHDRLFPHTHRIRRLHYGIVWTQSIHSAVALLSKGMPTLEVLKFPVELRDYRLSELSAVHLQDLALTHHRFPRLLDLNLVGVVAPDDIMLFANLRRLSLTHCAAKFSFSHFLDALGASEALEVLELAGFLQHLSHLPQDTGPTTRRQPLLFPRLTKLFMTKHSPSLTSQFLSHLTIPSTALLYVYSVLADVREDQVQETITAIMPPRPAVSLPMLALATDAEVTVHGGTYGLRCGRQTEVESEDDYSRPHFSSPYIAPEVPASHLVTLSIRSPAFDLWQSSLPKALNDLLQVFASATLTTLRVNAHCQQADAAAWEHLFLHLPRLALLVLVLKVSPDAYDPFNATGGLGEADTLFDGLRDASRSAAATTDPSPSGSPLQTACPDLKSICVEMDGIITPQLLDSVIECLRCRAGQGARLERLVMEQSSDATLKPALRRAYVSQLLEVVSELSFSRTVDGRKRDYVDSSGPAPFAVSDESGTAADSSDADESDGTDDVDDSDGHDSDVSEY